MNIYLYIDNKLILAICMIYTALLCLTNCRWSFG